MSYKLTDGTGVIRIADGAFIPTDPGNTDWREYLDWLADGNAPLPTDPEPPVPPAPLSAEELYDMVKAKGLVADADRPRPRP